MAHINDSGYVGCNADPNKKKSEYIPSAPVRAKLLGKSPVMPALGTAGPVLNPPSKNTGSDMAAVSSRRFCISSLFISSHELKFRVVTENVKYTTINYI